MSWNLRQYPRAAPLFLAAGNGVTVHGSEVRNLLRVGARAGCVAGPKLTAGATEYCLDTEEGLVTVKSSISLTDEQHDFARALVEAGRYSSLSAVLQQGVDLLRQRMDAEELETAALRELLSWRREGAFVSAAAMGVRLAGVIATKRRAHGFPS